MTRRDWITVIVILLLVSMLSNALKRGTKWEKLNALHSSVRRSFFNFLQDIERAGYRVSIISAKRSFQEQKILKEEDPRNASPGTSTHEYGTGIDILVYAPSGKRLGKHSPRAEWIASGIPQLAKAYGMRWGGNFKGYADNNHFDYLFT